MSTEPLQASRRAEPLVVACLPAYNAGAFIERTLHSVSGQTYGNLRILVSVDRSDDDTHARCVACADRDPRITVIAQPKRLGWVGNTNALLDTAEGDIFFLLAHDDVLAPEYVAALCGALVGNPAAVLAFSDVVGHRPDRPPELFRYRDLEGVGSRVERARRLIARTPHWWLPFRGLFHAWAIREIGGLRRNAAGEFAADWRFVIDMALLGGLVRVPEPLYHKDLRPTSLSSSWRYSRRSWAAATLSCAAGILRARLSVVDRMTLLGELAWHAPLVRGLRDAVHTLARRPGAS